MAVRGLTFVPFRLYEGLWRYTSIRDLRDIIGGVGSGNVLFSCWSIMRSASRAIRA